MLMAVSHFFFFLAPSLGSLWLVNICTGVGYGMCICGMNQVLSIYFGLPRFGFNHGLVCLPPHGHNLSS
jgi:hypothetical protein